MTSTSFMVRVTGDMVARAILNGTREALLMREAVKMALCGFETALVSIQGRSGVSMMIRSPFEVVR